MMSGGGWSSRPPFDRVGAPRTSLNDPVSLSVKAPIRPKRNSGRETFRKQKPKGVDVASSHCSGPRFLALAQQDIARPVAGPANLAIPSGYRADRARCGAHKLLIGPPVAMPRICPRFERTLQSAHMRRAAEMERAECVPPCASGSGLNTRQNVARPRASGGQ